MPIYEYQCSEHGLFEAQRAMSCSAEPAACPVCASAARRVLSATRTALVPRAARISRDRNEQSQHAPLVQRRAAPAEGARRRGFQVSHGSRPWVLEHG